MKNVINRAFMAKKKILFVLAAVCLFAASSWAQVDPCATVTDTVTVTFKLDDGSLTGNFSVASLGGGKYKKVSFSKGNLQYRATANGTGTDLTHEVAGGGTAQGIWRFAEHQYDFVGDATIGNVYEIIGEDSTKCSNELIANNYRGWVDLFGWATSGNSASGTLYQPWEKSQQDGKYGDNNPTSGKAMWITANSDWGYVNAISNGGNQPEKWRTLTYDEWRFLIGKGSPSRPNASSLRTLATVNGVQGLIILPDDWSLPAGQTMTITTENFTTDVYSVDQWNVLEAAGAVFMPASGYRYPARLWSTSIGYYWLANAPGGGTTAQHVTFNAGSVGAGQNSRGVGKFVRLVMDVTE